MRTKTEGIYKVAIKHRETLQKNGNKPKASQKFMNSAEIDAALTS